MREADLIGNIFLLDKHIGRKTFIITLLFALGEVFLTFIFQRQIISLNSLLYTFLIAAVVLITFQRKLIAKFFREYFIFNWIIFISAIFEIIMFIAIIYTGRDIASFFIGLLWLFSGLLRVIIQFSKALFESEIKEFMNIVQIFAYSRIGFFSLSIMVFSKTFKYDLPIFWLIYFLIIFFFIGWFMINLYPYANKHKNVKNAIKLLRIIKESKKIKINQLETLTKFSGSYFKKIIYRFSEANYIQIRNKRVELGKAYKYINR